MSTYTSDATNPKTSKTQTALFIDDFYGRHQYAVAFRKDGKDSQITDNLTHGLYDIYKLEYINHLAAQQLDQREVNVAREKLEERDEC